MSASLKVLRAGIHTTIQDAGRPGFRALGVPVSGALDRVALRLVNAVVGNPDDCGALEMLYSGAVVEAAGGNVRVALACAGGEIERAVGAARVLPAWQSAVLAPGERLRVAAPQNTSAAYLAVEGGFAVRPVLGSVSTYVPGGLGGLDGRSLRAGDTLELCAPDAAARAERRLAAPPVLPAPRVLRVMPGPQCDGFEPAALTLLSEAEFRVTPASNRSGIRLEGPRLGHRDGYDLLSEGVASGSVQVPGNGQPVLLLADHPTVGGYPKIATVIAADWAAAGRLRIGAAIRFAPVDAGAAQAARRALREEVERAIATLQDVRT